MCIAMLFTFSFQYSCTKDICQLCGSELQRHMNVNMCQHLWCKLDSYFETPPSPVPRLPQTSTTTQLRHRTTPAPLYHPSHLKLHFSPKHPHCHSHTLWETWFSLKRWRLTQLMEIFVFCYYVCPHYRVHLIYIFLQKCGNEVQREKWDSLSVRIRHHYKEVLLLGVTDQWR